MPTNRARLVVVIGAFKLVKAALLIALGMGGLLVLPERLARNAERAVDGMGISAGRHTIHHALGRLWSLDPSTEQRLGLLALGYAAVFLVEGVGLVRRKRWAEWLTVAVTASFVPFEIYELTRRFGAGKVATLVVNVAIALYLVWRRLEERRGMAGVLRRVVGTS